MHAACVIRNASFTARPPALAVALAVALALLAANLAGCQGPTPTGFESNDPTDRLDAIVAAFERGDRSDIPKLIDQLDTIDPAARLLAINALRRITGDDLGYDHTQSRSHRLVAISRWRAWAGEQGLEPRRESPRSVGELADRSGDEASR